MLIVSGDEGRGDGNGGSVDLSRGRGGWGKGRRGTERQAGMHVGRWEEVGEVGDLYQKMGRYAAWHST